MSITNTQRGPSYRAEVTSFTMAAQSAKVIFYNKGRYSAIDVWVNCPASWFDTPATAVILVLYGKQGSARVELARQDLSRVPNLETMNGGGTRSSIPITIRGRWCDGFDLTIERADGSAIAEAGDLFMEMWGCEETTIADLSSSPAADSAALAALSAALVAYPDGDDWEARSVWSSIEGPVKLSSFVVQNKGNGCFLQVHNKLAVVAADDIPEFAVPIDQFADSVPASNVRFTPPAPLRFTAAVQFVLSSTSDKYTPVNPVTFNACLRAYFSA